MVDIVIHVSLDILVEIATKIVHRMGCVLDMDVAKLASEFVIVWMDGPALLAQWRRLKYVLWMQIVEMKAGAFATMEHADVLRAGLRKTARKHVPRAFFALIFPFPPVQLEPIRLAQE